MGHTARQVVHHYSDNEDKARQVQASWSQVQGQVREGLAQVQEKYAIARASLAAAYLLELTPEALARAEKLTGFRGFTRRNPLKALAHETRVLRNTIARVVSDERWQRREYLVGPAGELTRERAEAASMLEPWQFECEKFESLDGFLELYSIGYDTPDWSEHWYEVKYWKHWAAGDRICESLQMADFGDDVLPAYEKVKAPRDQWRDEVAKVDEKIDAVHGLVKTRDMAEQKIPLLPDLFHAQAQQQLAEFFLNADLGLLEEWVEQAGGDRGVQQVLRVCAGLHAKTEFLRELLEQGVGPQIAEFERRRQKYARKAAKFSRSKYNSRTFSDRDLDTGFSAKYAKYNGQPGKLASQVDRLLRYDDYARFDLNNDPELWYIAFTGKSPSRYSPRTRKWYERHPNAAPTLTDEVGEAIATAAASFDSHDTGYLS